jgi:hypothetical protein
MAKETIKIIASQATERTIEIRVALFDGAGVLLTDEIYDSLESDGSHTKEQIEAFTKRKAILYLQRLSIQKNVIEDKIKTLPETILITPEDLLKTDPMTITTVKTK